MIPGYEADDVIGTVAKREGSPLTGVWMVTPDKDYGQLIDDNIFQLKPGKAGGKDEVLGKPDICAKYGISDPLQVIEMLTICGDTADNVPGVKGVGEVGAGKLIAKYGSVKGIYDHIDELSEKQRAMFEEARGHIELSHELVTIKTDVPVDISLEAMEINKTYSPATADLFELYEFNSLKRFLGHIAPSEPSGDKFETAQVNPSRFNSLASKSGILSIVTDTGGGGIFSPARRLTLSTSSQGKYYVSEGNVEDFAPLLSDREIVKCGFDLKFQANVLAASGVSLEGSFRDVGLMHYLLDPEKSHKIEILAKSYLGIDIEDEEEDVPMSLFDEAGPESEKSRTKEAAAALALSEKIGDELSSSPAKSLYDSMEEPLLKVLARMEQTGVKVDLGQLRSFADGLRHELDALQTEIREMAGEPGLNISSPKQIGDLLFDKLRLDPKAKRNSRGAYGTDETTLLDIADRHPIVDKILEFRAVKKLLSTYIEPFPSYIEPSTGKIHTTFNQALTATGRLSSSNPNLQNIPIRTERGKEIRKAFVPSRPDGVILSADYSQIELRIMAHLCADEHLTAAFRDGVDVHMATAAKIYGIPVGEVTREQRGIAKTANFGIMYGISSFGLAQRLRISRSAAKKIIDDYFTAFPSIRTYIDKTVADARENGYVETLFGRRRYLPDITSRNATVRALAERNAVNAPVQGTSADIIKLAMIAVDRRIREAGLQSRMVLQIHDELVFDAIPSEIETLKSIVVSEMENVIKLSVPLTVECNYGKNWLEAH